MRTPATLRLNAGDSINRGLVGFWPLNENAGTLARDLTPYRTTGVYERDPAFAVGLLGRTRTFTNAGGTNTKRVNLGTNRPWSSLQIPMTIAAWVRPTSLVNGTIFSQYNQFDVDGKFGKWLGVTNGGQVQAIIGKSVFNFYQFFNGPSYTLDRWALMAWTLRGSVSSPALRIYYNLTYTDHSPAAMGSVDPTVPTWIGSSVLASTYPSNEGFAGEIGPVRIWTRALSNGEIARLVADPWAGTAQVRLPIGPSSGTDYPLSADGITREYSFGDATFTRGRALTAEGLTRLYSFGDAVFTGSRSITAEGLSRLYSFGDASITLGVPSTGDTHDGFKRRSRRERALDAAAERQRQEWIAERNGLRLALEAAMGMAAEVVEDAPPVAVEAVQEAEQAARVVVPALSAPAVDLAPVRAALERLHAAVEEATRLRALAEDDEEVLMLLRAL